MPGSVRMRCVRGRLAIGLDSRLLPVPEPTDTIPDQHHGAASYQYQPQCRSVVLARDADCPAENAEHAHPELMPRRVAVLHGLPRDLAMTMRHRSGAREQRPTAQAYQLPPCY